MKDIENLVISGFHSMCCVKMLVEYAINNNINTIVDLELTEMLITNYYEKVYDKRVLCPQEY